MSHIDKK